VPQLLRQLEQLEDENRLIRERSLAQEQQLQNSLAMNENRERELKSLTQELNK